MEKLIKTIVRLVPVSMAVALAFYMTGLGWLNTTPLPGLEAAALMAVVLWLLPPRWTMRPPFAAFPKCAALLIYLCWAAVALVLTRYGSPFAAYLTNDSTFIREMLGLVNPVLGWWMIIGSVVAALGISIAVISGVALYLTGRLLFGRQMEDKIGG